MAIKTASKVGTHRNGHQNKVGVFSIVDVLIVALAAAEVKRSEQPPDGGIQWLPVKPWLCCIG